MHDDQAKELGGVLFGWPYKWPVHPSQNPLRLTISDAINIPKITCDNPTTLWAAALIPERELD